uniref:Homeobox domain-containing protein n=4 Tax=Rhizophora mucronata TaxID=61149 RepID=A0A2P2L5A0_RHIMU
MSFHVVILAGKRPRDLLNAKAVKYMQAIFSIKDAISKKESHEISAQFGLTVTQVREFFAGQRSRVRKLVRLSREKAIIDNSCEELHDGAPTSSDVMMPSNLVPLNSVGADPESSNSVVPNTIPSISVAAAPVPLDSVGPSSIGEAPSCLSQDDLLPGLDDLEKHFVENIFGSLRKEETFSGQVKLMEWILQIQNPIVLDWFLSKGGVMILASWLSEVAAEEQTSVLIVILKVLCHLPLNKALPEHMSAILHGVSRLRSYRVSDISNRAKVLLSRWSKIFARSQAIKGPNGLRSSTDAQEMILKQSINEIMGDELWQPNSCSPEEDVLALSFESSENIRKMESSQALKLLPASADDPSRKHILGASSSYTRERRKVQLVEQPGQRTAGRSSHSTKAVPSSQGRPMSADDIQKAKMRALYMQGKHGKNGSSSNGSNIVKAEGLSRAPSTLSSHFCPAPKVLAQHKKEEIKKPVTISPKISKYSEHLKQEVIADEPLAELLKKVKIPWKKAPEIKLNDLWRVGTGENSKEVDVQKNRNRREMETTYRMVQEIPPNPKEPWDLEMDYDDSLTPEIPIEQPPDTDNADTQVSHNESANMIAAPVSTLPQTGNGSVAEPDLELLAVLLKNPDLVFALTSGQASNLSSEQTVKLLDMIKKDGASLLGGSNGLGEVDKKVEVSLPSPTPSSNPGTSGWGPETDKSPFSKQSSIDGIVARPIYGVSTTIPSLDRLPGLAQPQIQATNIRIMQQQGSMSLPLQQVSASTPPFPVPQTSTIIPEKLQFSKLPLVHQTHIHPSNSSIAKTPTLMILPKMSATGPPVGVETEPIPSTSFTMNTPERRGVAFPLQGLSPTLTPVPMPGSIRSQMQPPHMTEPQPMYLSRSSAGNVGPMPDSWMAGRGLPSHAQSRASQHNYGPSVGGPVQIQMRLGPRGEKNEFVGNEVFESWSPENSPSRSSDYIPGRNTMGPRLNSGWEFIPDNRSMPQNIPRHGGRNRHEDRRWR